MTTTVLVSVGISAVVSLVLVTAFVLLRRGHAREAGADEAAVSRVVDELTARMDAMGRELSEALERTQEETRRSRVLGELAGHDRPRRGAQPHPRRRRRAARASTRR